MPLYKALSCDAFIGDNYTRSEYRQHLLIFIQAIKRGTRNPRHRAASLRLLNKNLTTHTLTSYLSKIKLCSDYYFKQDAASAGQRVHDAGDKATIKYINNSYRRAEYWFARTCFKCFIVSGINKWGRCMARCFSLPHDCSAWQFN